MNWQEAAEYFARKRDTLIWGLKDNRDETRQAHDAYNKAIDALCGPQPDPITGLVPCGCGEKAMLIGLQGFSYECIRCGTTTRNYEKEGQAMEPRNGMEGGRMNREEAAEFTRKLVARAETIVFPKTPKTINKIPVFYFEAVLSALRGPQPDPITGLVPCGCGGEVYPHYQLGRCQESGVQAFEVSTGCDGCGTCTKPRRGYYVNGIDKNDTELASTRDWNTSHGYTDPPLPEVKG